MKNGTRFFFATKALVLKDKTALVLRRADANIHVAAWDLPGGRIEFGETPLDGLSREVYEETQLDIIDPVLVDTWNYIASDYQIVGVLYHSKYSGKEVVLSDEHIEHKWVPMSQLLSFVYPVFVEPIKRFIESQIGKSNSI